MDIRQWHPKMVYIDGIEVIRISGRWYAVVSYNITKTVTLPINQNKKISMFGLLVDVSERMIDFHISHIGDKIN